METGQSSDVKGESLKGEENDNMNLGVFEGTVF